MKNSFRALAVLGLVAAGVAGCGGGGGGSSSSAPTLVITTDNAQAVASGVIQSVDGMFELSSLTGDQVSPTAAGTAGRTSAVRRVLSRLSRSHVQSLGAQPLVSVGPITESCDVSGFITLSGNLANPDTLSNGDRITASFDQCQDFDPFLLDGGLGLRVRAVQGNPLTDAAYLLTLDLTFTNLSVTDGTENFTADGDCTLTLDSLDLPLSRSRIAGRLLALSSSQEAFTLSDFDQSLDVDATAVLPEDYVYVAEALGALASDLLGGRVNYTTVAPVTVVGENDPDSGELLVTGADGTTVRIVVVDSTSVQLQIDADGNGSVDATQDTTWPALKGDI